LAGVAVALVAGAGLFAWLLSTNEHPVLALLVVALGVLFAVPVLMVVASLGLVLFALEGAGGRSPPERGTETGVPAPKPRPATPSGGVPQTQPTDEKPQNEVNWAQVGGVLGVIGASAAGVLILDFFTSPPAPRHVKKDGTPDMRYKENKEALNKRGWLGWW
jgi:hypothetical protein